MKNRSISRWLSGALAVLLLVSGAGARCEAAQDPLAEKCAYVLETFELEEAPWYPYRPTAVDPVNYSGYLSMVSGLKGDDYHAAYAGYTAEDVAGYLTFLSYWGYRAEAMDSGLPGVSAWQLVSDAPTEGPRTLMPSLQVYHAAERALLIVRYAYLDAWLSDAWAELTGAWWLPELSEPVQLPCTIPLREGVSITVEEVRMTEQLTVLSGGELTTYPYARSVLGHLGGTFGSGRVGDGQAHVLRANPDNFCAYIPCVRISFDPSLRGELIRTLRAATVSLDLSSLEEADCVDASILLLDQAVADSGVFTVAGEEGGAELWVAFRQSCAADMLQRFCFRLAEPGEWIGDLRDWAIIQVYLEEDDLF